MLNNNKIHDFWKWFSANEKTFGKITKENREKTLDNILLQLNKIQINLAVEISEKRNDGKHEIIISAEGDKEKFDIVKRIVQQAPTIDDWIVTAFRQRANQNFKLQINDLVLDTDAMYFTPIIDDLYLDLIIYGEGFHKHDENIIFQYGLIVMDNLVGEYDSVTAVRYYDFKDISEVESSDKLLPLMKLPEYIDKRKKA